MTNTYETVVIGLGGSLVFPNVIGTEFLQNFKALIKHQLKTTNRRFIIIVGGGNPARLYQNALAVISPESQATTLADQVGIGATKANALFVRALFCDDAFFEVINDPEDITKLSQERLVIASGFEPGCSTDFRAVEMAELSGANKVINLSTITHVKAADWGTNPNAKKLTTLSWSDYRKTIPKKWSPGMKAPYDPIAAKKAEGLGMTVATIGGENLSSIVDFLEERGFIGTTMHP